MREAAGEELAAIGTPALGPLYERAPGGDAEFEARCRAAIRAINRSRAEGDVELTALAVLAYFGAGYSHLSKDGRNGFEYGKILRAGTQWLLARQKDDGAFDADDARNAIASLAIIEAWGLTGSALFKDAAFRAQECVDRRPAGTPRALFWKCLALLRGEVSGCPAARNLPSAVEPVADPYAGALAVLLARRAKGRAGDAEAALAAFGRAEPEAYFAATLGLFVADGPRGEKWRKWGDALRDRLVRPSSPPETDCRHGSWAGSGLRDRLRSAALHTLSTQIYYRYANVVATGF